VSFSSCPIEGKSDRPFQPSQSTLEGNQKPPKGFSPELLMPCRSKGFDQMLSLVPIGISPMTGRTETRFLAFVPTVLRRKGRQVENVEPDAI
jgi:hypothetical protein